MCQTMSLAAPTLPSWVIEMGGENHGHSHDGPELIGIEALSFNSSSPHVVVPKYLHDVSGRGYFGVDAEDMFSVPTQAPEVS